MEQILSRSVLEVVLFALLAFRLVLVIPNLARWLSVPTPLMVLAGILWLMAVVPVLEMLPKLLVVALILSCLAGCWLGILAVEPSGSATE